MPPISTLTEDWTAGIDPAKWVVGGDAAVSGGKLSIPPDATYTDQVETVDFYDLTSGELFAEVTPTTGSGVRETYMGLHTGSFTSTRLAIGVNAGNLYGDRRISGSSTTVFSIPYDAVAHRWWRIRHSGGMIRWDTSPEGLTWTERASWTPTFSITSLKALFGAGGTTGGTPATVDNVNLAPSVPFVRSSSVSTATQAAPTMTVPKPVGTAVGDVLYLIAASDDGIAGVPAGWTQIYAGDGVGANGPIRARVFRRVADGTEGATFTVTYSATCDASQVCLAVVGGSGSEETFSVFSENTATAGSASMVANSVTPPRSGALLVAAFAARNLSGAAVTSTPPAGMIELQDDAEDWISLSVSVSAAPLSTADPTGTRTATPSSTVVSGNFLMAIPSVASVGPVPLFTGADRVQAVRASSAEVSALYFGDLLIWSGS